MISSEQILIQIEKQVHKAKIETNEQSTREALVAIRANCRLFFRVVTFLILSAC